MATTPRLDRAAELVQELAAAGIKATRSVAAAAQQLPCVLIPPPTLGPGTYAGPTITWRLVALAANPLGDVDSWAQIDALVEQLMAALPVERAEPTSYQLPNSDHPLPAYFVTLTES